MLEIRQEPELDTRLDRLAKETGRTKSYSAKQAIKQFWENREGYLLGIAALAHNELRTTLADIRKELDLER